MILENLALDDREAAQLELADLADELKLAGDFDVRLAPIDGSFHAKIQESAGHLALDVINVVLEEAEQEALGAVVGVVVKVLFDWGKRRRQFRGTGDDQPTAIIWGPDGHPLKEVRLPDPEE